jgi:hypothetical protein
MKSCGKLGIVIISAVSRHNRPHIYHIPHIPQERLGIDISGVHLVNRVVQRLDILPIPAACGR